MGDEPFLRLNAYQRKCSSDTCGRIFSAEVRGKACSRCKMSYYCNQKCQKDHWKQHKVLCVAQVQAMKDWEAGAADRPDQPPLMTDLNHFVGMSSYSIRQAARTAMKLGRPDSLALTHLLHIEIEYETPPKERWQLTNPSKPVGDERSFFKYTSLNVFPDSWIDENKPMGEDSTSKKVDCKAGTNSEVSTIYVIYHAVRQNCDPGQSATFAAYFRLPHQDDWYDVPYAKRALNPHWRRLGRMSGFLETPKNDREDKGELYFIEMADLAQSESLETLRRSKVKEPRMGWETFEENRCKTDPITVDWSTDAGGHRFPIYNIPI